jgi:hypothetical protein
MPSTYSSNLKLELMATGENSGTWGNITNTNLGTAAEQAIVGYGSVVYASDANLTISITNSNAAQAARALVLNVTSSLSLTGTRELVVPTIEKQYIVQNNTTGSQSITVKTSAGTGITVPNGRKAHLYVDGTNVIQMFDFVDINGGTIDGTAIGGSSAAAGAFTTLAASGATTLNGAVTLGDAAGDNITFNGTVTSHLLFTDNTYDIGASGATRPRNLYLAGAATIGGNLSVGGTLTLTGGVNLNGNVTVGDSAADTLTINSTITSNLIFTDNTYDIGASGATRPRNLFLAGNITAGGNQTLTGSLTVDSTTDSSSTTTGSIQTDGGLGVAKAVFIGTTLNVAGSTTLGDASGDTLTINGTAVSIPNSLNFDSNTLVIDATNNKVGFNGATSPGSVITGYSDAGLDGRVFEAYYGSGNNRPLNIGVNRSSGDAWLGWNAYQSSTDTQIRQVANNAARISGNGGLLIQGAATDTASSVITWTRIADLLYTGTVFNEDGADIDFRIESDTNANAFFVDAGNSLIGMGTGAPEDYLELYYSDSATTGTAGMLITNSSSTNSTIASLTFRNYDNFNAAIKSIRTGSSNGLMTFETNVGTGTAETNLTEKMRITVDGIVVNNGALDYDFRIASDNNSYAFFVDAGNDQVVVGSSTSVTGSASNIPLVVRYSSGPGIKFYSNASASRIATVGISLTTYGDSRYAGYQTVSGGGLWTNSSSGSTTFLTAPASGVVRIGNFSQDPLENTSVSYVEYAAFNSGEIVFNDESRDIDFRVESDGQSYAFFVDAGNNAVGINTSNPTTNNAASVRLTMGSGDSSSKIQQNVNGGGATYGGTDIVNNPSNGFRMGHINGTDRWELGVGSNDTVLDARATSLTVNQGGADSDFRVEADTNDSMLFVDAGNSRVGFGTSSPNATISIPNISNSSFPVTNFERDRSSRIHVFSGSAGTKTVTITMSDYGLTGFVAYVDVSGHYYTNGNDKWYDRYVWALMEESGSTRFNVRLTNYEFTNGTSRVSSPAASFPGGGQTQITFTVTAYYDTKVWVKVESAGSAQITGISVA